MAPSRRLRMCSARIVTRSQVRTWRVNPCSRGPFAIPPARIASVDSVGVGGLASSLVRSVAHRPPICQPSAVKYMPGRCAPSNASLRWLPGPFCRAEPQHCGSRVDASRGFRAIVRPSPASRASPPHSSANTLRSAARPCRLFHRAAEALPGDRRRRRPASAVGIVRG